MLLLRHVVLGLIAFHLAFKHSVHSIQGNDGRTFAQDTADTRKEHHLRGGRFEVRRLISQLRYVLQLLLVLLSSINILLQILLASVGSLLLSTISVLFARAIGGQLLFGFHHFRRVFKRLKRIDRLLVQRVFVRSQCRGKCVIRHDQPPEES